MGKTRETQQSIDPRLTEAAVRNLDRAEAAGYIPFMPNRGATVAAFTPQQTAAFDMSNQAASAFGFSPLADYVPPPVVMTGGVAGHSAAPIYDEMKALSVDPARQQQIDSFFPAIGANVDIARGGGNKLRDKLKNGGILDLMFGPVKSNSGGEMYGRRT